MSGRTGHREHTLVSSYLKEGAFLERVLSSEYKGQRVDRKWPLTSESGPFSAVSRAKIKPGRVLEPPVFG